MSIIGDYLGLIIVIALFLVPLVGWIMRSINDPAWSPQVRRDGASGSSASGDSPNAPPVTRRGMRNRFEEARESLAERVRQNEMTFKRPNVSPEMQPESVEPERFPYESATVSQEQRWEQSRAPEARPELLSGLAPPARNEKAVAADDKPASQPTPRPTRRASMRLLLSSREGLRQVIIAQEVLGPPKSMREPGDGSRV